MNGRKLVLKTDVRGRAPAHDGSGGWRKEELICNKCSNPVKLNLFAGRKTHFWYLEVLKTKTITRKLKFTFGEFKQAKALTYLQHEYAKIKISFFLVPKRLWNVPNNFLEGFESFWWFVFFATTLEMLHISKILPSRGRYFT